MFCPRCGARNVDNARFCSSCGAPLGVRNIPPAGTGENPGTGAWGGQQPVQPVPGAASPAPARPRGRLRWVVPTVAAACLVVAAFVMLCVVGVSLNGGPSSRGGVAVMDAFQVGPVSFGGVRMGNTASNYANGAMAVSDGTYDYFFSAEKGGICRAAKDGSGVNVIVPRPDIPPYTVSGFSLDEDTLFYKVTQDNVDSDGVVDTIRAVKTNGGDDHEVCSFKHEHGYFITGGVYLYDGRLYALDLANVTDDLTYSYDVWTMDEDGSNKSKIGTFSTVAGTYAPFLTKDKMYFCQTENGDHGHGSVYVQDLDGSDRQQLYTSSTGTLYGTPLVVDGKIYVDGHDYDNEKYQVIRMNADGSDASTIYTHDAAETDTTYIEAVTHGSAYVFCRNGEDDGTVARVPLDGSPTTEASVPGSNLLEWIYEAGDHLVVMRGNSYLVFDDIAIYTTDFDGNKLQDYVTAGS
jgi:hypothetical protein